MKFICNQNTLQDSINTIQKAVSPKPVIVSLNGILIESLDGKIRLTSSDYDISIETLCEAEIEEEGQILIDSKIFGDIIRKLPNKKILIKANSDNNQIEIKCEKSVFKINYLNAEDYTKVPEMDDSEYIDIKQSILKDMIKGTIFSVAQDDTRPILKGVLLETENNILNLMALDGFRLALRYENIELKNNIKIVIPGKTLNEISKIISDNDDMVKINFSNNQILFTINDTKVYSRLLNGDFIKYQVPKEYNTRVLVNRHELLDSCERASVLSNSLIKLNLSQNTLIITSNSQIGDVREEVSVKTQGNPLEIAFNSKYLLDVLKTMVEENIYLELTSSISPCIIKNSQNDNCTYLILPVRLS